MCFDPFVYYNEDSLTFVIYDFHDSTLHEPLTFLWINARRVTIPIPLILHLTNDFSGNYMYQTTTRVVSYANKVCPLTYLMTAFQMLRRTDQLAAMMIFSTICLRDMGLILVIDEMDEEYWQDLIDRCILCHPSEGIPSVEKDEYFARVDVICGDLIKLSDASIVYLWSRWLKYARYA